MTDPATEERVVIQFAEDTFFFIPLHWAGCGIALIGVGVVLYDMLKCRAMEIWRSTVSKRQALASHSRSYSFGVSLARYFS